MNISIVCILENYYLLPTVGALLSFVTVFLSLAPLWIWLSNAPLSGAFAAFLIPPGGPDGAAGGGGGPGGGGGGGGI